MSIRIDWDKKKCENKIEKIVLVKKISEQLGKEKEKKNNNWRMRKKDEHWNRKIWKKEIKRDRKDSVSWKRYRALNRKGLYR